MNVCIKKMDGYELVASGDGRKLERFGKLLLDRPSPQAIWPKNGSDLWNQAHAIFERGEGGTGRWLHKNRSKTDSWSAQLWGLSFELRLTGFGNVGVFPEHIAHLDWMTKLIAKRKDAAILNLFAYTGGASMACAKAGAQVIHVDAAKSVNGWAIANAKRSHIEKDSMRVFADDALKFVKRQQRQKKRYDGIVLDPPTFGRGTKGEVWKIERDLYPLVAGCIELLSPNPLFLLLTSHSPGITPSVTASVLEGANGTIESGEMLINGGGPPLPAGVFARLTA